MNKETQLGLTEKPGFLFRTVKYIGSNVFGFLFEQYINVMHSLLSAAQRQMLSLVPEDSPTMDKYQQAELMNAAINAAFEDPRVQESLKAFQQNIKDVIQPFLAELTELFEKEGETLEKSAVKVVDKIAHNSVNMAYNSALAAVETVPGIGTIMSLLTVLQGAVDTVSTLSSEGMKAYTMFMKSFLRVVGETSGPIADTVENASRLLDGVKTVRNELAENLAKIPAKKMQLANPLNKKIGEFNKLKSNLGKAASIVSDPRGHLENLVNDQVNKATEPFSRQLQSTVGKIKGTIDMANQAASIAENPTGYLSGVARDQLNQATEPFRQKTSLVGGRKKKRTIKRR
jgi:ABC-type transporter Mla subunit MlaD